MRLVVGRFYIFAIPSYHGYIISLSLILHRLLLDLNSRDRDVLEVNDNNIECSNLKSQKYMRSRNVPTKRHKNATS